MPVFIVMEKELLAKLTIAKEQLRDAGRLYNEQRFSSAITLAGAAEEIIGKLLESESNKEIKTSIDTATSYILEFCEKTGNEIEEREIKKYLNYPRNATKHLKSDGRRFDAQYEAADLIDRAVINLTNLMDWSEVPDECLNIEKRP